MRAKQKKLLLELRSKLVGELHTQPFTIYNDATIEALLDAQPKSISELSKVKGFPADGKRIKGFGETVVRIFKNCDDIVGFEFEADEEPSICAKAKKMKSFQ